MIFLRKVFSPPFLPFWNVLIFNVYREGEGGPRPRPRAERENDNERAEGPPGQSPPLLQHNLQGLGQSAPLNTPVYSQVNGHSARLSVVLVAHLVAVGTTCQF